MESKIKYNISGLRGVVGKTFTPPVLMDNLIAFQDISKKEVTIKGGKKDQKFLWPRCKSFWRSCLSIYYRIAQFTRDRCRLWRYITNTNNTLHRKNGNYDGGVAITASHNPIEYNALKLAKFGGYFLFPVDVEEISSYIDNPVLNFSTYESIGTTRLISDAWQSHIDNALKNLIKIS
jgi:phosphomannomutase